MPQSESDLSSSFGATAAGMPAGSISTATDEGFIASYHGLTLRSSYQPVASIVRGRAVGYEALLRATNPGGMPVPPPVVFQLAEQEGELDTLNRLVCELHFANFGRQFPDDHWLFINISSQVFSAMLDGQGNLIELCGRYGIAPTRLVVEVLEKEFVGHDTLAQSVLKFKEAGVMVAIDDFGKGQSNFDRVFQLAPAIVKFDLSLVVQGRSNPRFGQVCRHLTDMLHSIGAFVVAEGVEGVDDALFMVDAGVDFLQGYWISRPIPAIDDGAARVRIQDLRSAWIERRRLVHQIEQPVRTALRNAMARAVELFAATGDIMRAAECYFTAPGTRRFFILDQDGFDIGAAASDHARLDANMQERFAALRPSRESNMFHRRYFNQAIQWPDQFHFVPSFFSITDGTVSDIVSKAVYREGKYFVACGLHAVSEENF